MLKKLNDIKNNHEEGFTLTELIVVIVIIGILAAIAVPMYLNNRKQAIDAQTESNIKNIAVAADRIFYENPNDPNFKEKVESEMKINNDEGGGTQYEITFGTGSNAFCIKTWNEAGSKYISEEKSATFDSSAGGLNKWSNNCNTNVVVPTSQCTDYFGGNPAHPEYENPYYQKDPDFPFRFTVGIKEDGTPSFAQAEFFRATNPAGTKIKVELLKDGVILDSYEGELYSNFRSSISNDAVIAAAETGLEIKVYKDSVLYRTVTYTLPSDFYTNTDYCLTTNI